MSFESTITLDSLFRLKSHEAQVLDIESVPLGSELKFRLRALFLGKNISFIVREVDDDYIEMWKMLKKSGLPVVPILRKTNYFSENPIKKTVAMYDFTSDGSKVYGKDLDWQLQVEGEDSEYVLNDVDTCFLNIMKGQFDAVRAQALHFCNMATAAGIILPEDHEAFELQVSPDGTWHVVMIDTQLARKASMDEAIEDVREINTDLTNDFFHFLLSLENTLSLMNGTNGGHDEDWW